MKVYLAPSRTRWHSLEKCTRTNPDNVIVLDEIPDDVPPCSCCAGLRAFKCRNGHRWRPETTRHYSNGRRMVRRCIICEQEKDRRRVQPRDRYAKRKARNPRLAPDDPRHGTVSGYNNWACRCEPCRAAIRETHRRRREARKRSAEIAALAELTGDSTLKRCSSLDAIAAARYGYDRIALDDEWADPVQDAPLDARFVG